MKKVYFLFYLSKNMFGIYLAVFFEELNREIT